MNRNIRETIQFPCFELHSFIGTTNQVGAATMYSLSNFPLHCKNFKEHVPYSSSHKLLRQLG